MLGRWIWLVIFVASPMFAPVSNVTATTALGDNETVNVTGDDVLLTRSEATYLSVNTTITT